MYGEILCAASRWPRQLVVWHALRRAHGAGLVPCGEAVRTAARLFPRLNRTAVRDVLRSGEGRFWNVDAGRVWVWRPARVCNALRIFHIRPHAARRVPLSILVGSGDESLQHLRARLALAGVALVRDDHGTSNASAAAMTARTGRTIQNYARCARAQVTRIPQYDCRGQWTAARWHEFQQAPDRARLAIIRCVGTPFIGCRLPDRFASELSLYPSARSAARRLGRDLRTTCHLPKRNRGQRPMSPLDVLRWKYRIPSGRLRYVRSRMGASWVGTRKVEMFMTTGTVSPC